MTQTRLTYRFGPLERRGILGPLRPTQATVLAVGLLAGVIALSQSPTVLGAMLATSSVALATVLATAPLAGRTAEEWAPVVGAFLFGRVGGQGRFRSPVPSRGFRSRHGSLQEPTVEPPRAIREIRIAEAVYRDRRIGVLSERGGRLVTAVLACRVVSFSLLDAEAQERRLARWGLILSGAASSRIRRLQWVERTAPA